MLLFISMEILSPSCSTSNLSLLNMMAFFPFCVTPNTSVLSPALTVRFVLRSSMPLYLSVITVTVELPIPLQKSVSHQSSPFSIVQSPLQETINVFFPPVASNTISETESSNVTSFETFGFFESSPSTSESLKHPANNIKDRIK